MAQKDSTKLSFKEYYVPTGIRVGTDAISLLMTQYNETFSGWEVSADVDFYRYFLAVEYGHWSRRYNEPRWDYLNDGNYFRVGADVNFLTKDPERNMFFVGARYGRATFDESLLLLETRQSYESIAVPASWYELTTGLKVKIWSFFWMGYTARFKFGLNTDERGDMVPHDVPGYGRTDKDSYWGFNYQLMFRIPVRPAPALPASKKKKK